MLLNLKNALLVRRKRQVELARELEIDPSTLSLIINGWREAPAELRARIADLLGENETFLFQEFKTRGPGSQDLTPGGGVRALAGG